MNVCPANETFTLAVHAAGGSEWGVAVTSSPDGGYDAEFCRVAPKRPPGDELTCVDARKIRVLGTARFMDRAELRATVECWRHGKLVATQPPPNFPIDGDIPVFIAVTIIPGVCRWLRLTDNGTLAVPQEEYKFCGPLV